jgi:hypothetical protein
MSIQETRAKATAEIIAQAIVEYQEILKQENIILTDNEAAEQAIGLLNLFDALLSETEKEYK